MVAVYCEEGERCLRPGGRGCILSCIESQSSQGARQLPRKSSSVQNPQLRAKMAMRYERSETVRYKDFCHRKSLGVCECLMWERVGDLH